MVNNTGREKAGRDKIKFCAEQAAKDGLRYIWVDSCCIRKSSDSELTEAFNSMFRWYQRAAKCYVYLSDVLTRTELERTSQNNWEPGFQASRWFTRGWTLQELLAPSSVEFFSKQHERLGDKQSLKQKIHEISRIPVLILKGQSLPEISIEERMSWAAKRGTKREEDKVYSLLGIFDISMPLIYGEGEKTRAAGFGKKLMMSQILQRLAIISDAPPRIYRPSNCSSVYALNRLMIAI